MSFGTPGSNTDPAIQIGNATSAAAVTDLLTNDGIAVADIISSVFGIANEQMGGVPKAYLLAIDLEGDVGIEGSLNIQAEATDPASITAGDGYPVLSPNYGSLYMRTDADASAGPRLLQYSEAGTKSDSPGWLEIPAGLGIFNVKEYGAAGDDGGMSGTTNDTPAIQSAIDAARIAGGGVIYFPAGKYRLQEGSTAGTCLNIGICQGNWYRRFHSDCVDQAAISVSG